jgi:hypothetical protein
MTPELIYEQTDIPPGMSCAEYRRTVAARTPPHGVRATLRRLRTAGPGGRGGNQTAA